MIIGLTGRYLSGKDTIADHLVAKYNFRKVGFSDVMYDAVAGLMDITVEEASSPDEFKRYAKVSIEKYNEEGKFENGLGFFTWREFLQRFGTEMGRNVFGQDFWCDMFAKKYLMVPQNLVIRDVRFNNEANLLKSMELNTSHIWQVIRPGFEGDSHESELGIHEAYIDADVENTGTIEELLELIDKAMTEVYGFDG